MKRPAKLLFATCLATIVATASSHTTAAESEAPAQVLVHVDVTDKVLSAHWTKLPDAYVLRVVIDQPKTPARSEDPPVDKPAPLAVTGTNDTIAASGVARGSFFLGNTIANLRGMDPVFGCRTLTLVDARRVVQTGQQPAPTVSERQVVLDAPPLHELAPNKAALMHQPYPPRYKDPRIDVWLLKTDGTQILPATYSCEWGKADPTNLRRVAEISYEFPLASTDQAVAAAIRIEDRFFIEKLQPAPKPAPR